MLLLYGLLSAFVLGSIANFAADHAEQDLKSFGREVSDILADAYDQLVLSGKVNDPGEMRVAKARALARLEKRFRLVDIPGVVADADAEPLMSYGIDNPAEILGVPLEFQRATAVTLGGEKRFVYEVQSHLWGWRVLVAEGAAGYSKLAEDIRNLYLGTGGLLLLTLAGFLAFSQRTVSRPVSLIAKALKRGDRPRYEAIQEFDSLCASIRNMMDSLDERERLVSLGRTWYQQMFESAPVMMFSLTPDGTFHDVNYRFTALTGYVREQLLASAVSRILTTETESLEDLWMGVPLRGVPGRLRTARGRVRKVLLDALLTEDAHGQRVVLAVVIDVTDQQRFQAELIAAKEAAESSNKAKSEFLANVSHEIRTPLNGALGMLELLEKSPLDARQAGWVKNALECNRSLLTLLGDILDFSNLESGRQQTAQEPFSPGALINDAVRLFSGQARAKQVSVSIEADPGLPETVVGDAGRLRQVLFNLMGNAVKFTQQGLISLRVEAIGQDRQDHLRLLYSIEDTGIGIDAQKLGHVFEPFTQEDGSHTRRYQGAGLGLAIVKRLVSLWGGNLNIDSEPGSGTCVSFTMPVRLLPSGPEAQPSIPAAATPAVGGRVLLAEDDPVNTVMTMDMLESLGYRATIVDNGADAIKALSQEEFDCLLMDVQMPQLDGLEATRTIRTTSALGEKVRIPIVALAAHTLPGDRERFLAAGIDDYIVKPVEYEDLAGVLTRVMNKPWRRRLS